jgi:hypothetical protein
MAAFMLTFGMILSGCGSSGVPPSGGVILANGGIATGPAAPTGGSSGEDRPSPYLVLNQRYIEGVSATALDLNDADAVFWQVFSSLPEEVTVYPSENYYYFILYVDRRQIWGNLRLPAGRRELGVLVFAYFEFKESPYVTDPRVTNSKEFDVASGLTIQELDRFTFLVRYRGKEVTFHLHQLSQDQPRLFRLGEDEVSVMRTFDESGYQFFLLFNLRGNYFTWVLNEEELLPDALTPLAPDLLVGKRSGFAFWIDPAHSDRKALLGVRGANATINNYYDGPFDQLADNYVDQTNISEYMMRASPGLRGRLSKYGYFLDREANSRLAITPYYVYFTGDALKAFVETVRTSDDPYYTISRHGVSATPTPGP